MMTDTQFEQRHQELFVRGAEQELRVLEGVALTLAPLEVEMDEYAAKLEVEYAAQVEAEMWREA